MHSMAKVVYEMGEQRRLQLEAPVEAIPRLSDLVDRAVAATERLDSQAAENNCFEIMREYSPLQIPVASRRNFLLLLIKNISHRHINEFFFVCESRKKLKLDYLQIITDLPQRTAGEIRFVLDVGLQALCKDTAIGRIFHIKRSGTDPSITKGSLKKLAVWLQEVASHYEVRDLHFKTQIALQVEALRSKSFARKLQKHYPALYQWVQPVIDNKNESSKTCAIAMRLL